MTGTDRNGLAEHEHVPFHCGNQGVVVRTFRQVEYGIKAVNLDLAPAHAAQRGTGPRLRRYGWGNSRKSSVTVSGFTGTSMEWQGIKWMLPADVLIPDPGTSIMRPSFDPVVFRPKPV